MEIETLHPPSNVAWWVRAAPVAASAILAMGAAILTEQLSTAWIDSAMGGPRWADKGWFYFGFVLLVAGLTWSIAVTTSVATRAKPSYDAILARLGFALVVVGLLTFIGLFGLASRGLLIAVVRPLDSEIAHAAVASVRSTDASDERLPSGLEYLVKPTATSGLNSGGRERVIWAARMSLLPCFAVLGSMFFVCGSLQRKRSEEEELEELAYNPERFWSGFWYRMGEGVLFALVAFLASYAGFLDGAGEKSWSGVLLLLGLLMAMFVKPAEQLVNGLALRLFEAVSTFTNRTLKEAPNASASDPLTAIVSRLNDSLETVRLQAVRELEQLAKTRYDDVIDILAAFIRQQAGKAAQEVGHDTQQAFVALGTLKAPRGMRRKAVSLRKAILAAADAPEGGLDLSSIDLSDATLVGANLMKSNFTSAVLNKARLENAHLEGANLHEAKDLEKAVLDGAWYDQATSFPENFDPVAARMRSPSVEK